MPSLPDDSAIFHALLHGSADNIYIFDRDLRYTHVSRGGAERLGRKPEEMAGKTWHELGLPPETMLSVDAQLRRVFETGETVRHEILFAGHSFEYVIFPVHDRVAVVSRDVTGRVQAEEELRRASERYRAFVANSSEGIWRFEMDEPMNTRTPVEDQINHAFKYGYLGECNDAMARMYGFERAEEIIGARLPDMLDPNQEQNREFVRAFITSGYRLNDAESAETDRHGNHKYFLNSFIGIVEKGLLLRAWGTQRDITDHKAHAIENARLYQQAVEANRAKDEFLATLSHELRTPLTAILGWANLLRLSGYEMETARKAVETIEQSARTQAAIIDDLLDVSRIVTGKFSLNVATVDAVPIVHAVVASTQPAAEAKGLTISVDTPESLLMRADSNRLQQIIWNLMSNAVKFSRNGGVIDVGLRREKDDAVLEVRDAGIGIKPELLPRVFDRFWQADSSTHRTQGGLGLGLAIVKHLAELHGGTASASSGGPGLGATFTIRLPIGVVSRAADAKQVTAVV